jgi:uncharacterized membrane protein YdbT with pleckstrin-like domain
MPYPQRLLNEGEGVVLDLRPHWWFFSRQFAGGVLLVALAVAVARLPDDLRGVGWIVFAALAVIWALWLGGRLLRWQTTHFVVTTDRLIFRSGVIAKHGREILLERVNDITFHQSILERLLGAGDLMIESAGERGQEAFDNIAHPESVQQEIYRQIEGNTRKTAGYSRADATIPEQIAQLADLRDRGLLSATEFEAKKADLLKRM